eukprot:TRINITY_DN14173_c0_g1_i1.p1 TRINITY_DN14173_c0_g1~~TRINITY_DN14173_c0_g1_i1.p1  ORF type:complete len:235 (-),score=46.90 TRINITY_DN14173_c0_g1_i1:13-717(-)
MGLPTSYQPQISKRDGYDQNVDPRTVYIVLENAPIESAKVDERYQLLAKGSHDSYIRRILQKDPEEYRPDILHSSLKALLDSPLNKAGFLRIYIHTQNNAFIYVNPKLRIPRTYPRFASLMVHLLNKQRVSSTDGQDVLLKLVKSNVNEHLPPNSHRVALSFTAPDKPQNVRDYALSLPDDRPVVFVVGAMAKGHVNVDYVPQNNYISISEYPLAAYYVCNRITNAFEQKHRII